MPTTVNFNGTNYSVPNNREPKGWGATLTTYLIALGQNALAKSGGTFTLTADVNFGANFGIIAKYFKSQSGTIAASEIVRLANDEGIAWRNNDDSADKALKVNTSDNLEYGGNKVFDQSDLLDEDNMASDSSTKPASQQSIKAYADTKVPQTNPVINGTISGTAFLDEDNMASNSATKVASQQSIKAYVDTEIAAATGGGTSYVGKSADYVVLDGDGYRVIGVTTGASDVTITLPTAADNTNRIITIMKIDSGAGEVIIDGEGSETVGSATSTKLSEKYQRIQIVCDGSGWQIMYASPNGSVVLDTGNGRGSTNTAIRRFTNSATSGDAFTYADDASNAHTITVNRDCIAAIEYYDRSSTSGFAIGASINSASLTTQVTDISVSERIAFSQGTANQTHTVSVTRKFSKNDVIRAHVNTDSGLVSTDRVRFSITEIDRVG